MTNVENLICLILKIVGSNDEFTNYYLVEENLMNNESIFNYNFIHLYV